MVSQGRAITSNDVRLIRRLMEENPSWHRTRLSRELCTIWSWRAASGQYKDMACRSLLLKLEKKGHIVLPPRIKSAHNSLRNRQIQFVLHPKLPLHVDFKALGSIHVEPIQTPDREALFSTLLSSYHYLGYTGAVGENIKYMAFDRDANPLACLLFGSAAWKTEARDTFIGWDAETRKHNLHLITNNMRFLILPWVRVPHLASHILGRIGKRISADWTNKYSHPIHLLETFVDHQRFRGVCYKAANWRYVGQTKGRSRNDRHHTIQVPVKDIYLYPLTKDFQEALRGGEV